ncbi:MULTISPECIES: hypothetical protein [Pseudomonas]|uniref:hypothetical protein n=1 Tax=Pseudomonas TaxID=286 RepID=UPI0006D3AC0D|nr:MULTISPECIES: hypothetical protein [Pseudomonas]MCK2111298.1 hypothetical protein [Pseudomonas juntendi]MCK2115215.1 hypothetical protein [Pseudomonas juntendi]MDG9889556.1 hypothetical protein [Pseudomonas juntendi]MDG9917899.1 hypothetical protein [Pseudomonas juntendi]MDH0044116.1 hypothetical protein [Pseudomonas juntendi]
MAITTKIQQIISDLQATEQLLNKQVSESTRAPQQSMPTQTAGEPIALSNLNHKILTLQTEIEQLSNNLILKDKDIADLNSEVERLKIENRRISQELYHVRKESLIAKNQKDQIYLDNELLVKELTKVQAELELYYEDRRALEATLTNTNETLERASATINYLGHPHSL